MSDATSLDSPAIHVFRITALPGATDYVTLLSPELATATGLSVRTIVGTLAHPLAEGETITPNLLTVNGAFVDLMQEVIARHGPGQPECIAEARRLVNGWVFVVDQRTKDPG